MATSLADLADAFRREVAVPGTFAATYPATTLLDITGTLADAFAQAQLDGLFGDHVLDLDTLEVSPDLSLAGQALIVIYAGMRMVRAELQAANTNTRYKAGPVEYETARSAAGFVQLLKDLAARRAQLLAALRTGANLDTVLDGYGGRAGTPLLLAEPYMSLYRAGL